MIVKNRLTTSYKIAGTDTFRLASSKLLGYYGNNLQNSSDSLMRCIIPDDNCIFLQPDQAGAEALIVAYECRPGNYRRLFELGIKVHTYMALQIFVTDFANALKHPTSRYKFIAPDTLTSYPELKTLLSTVKNHKNGTAYHLGKKVIHAKSYDMGPRTFQIEVLKDSQGRIMLSFAEAKAFLSTHEQIFPEIQENLAYIQAKLTIDRELRNLFGYPRKFNGLWSDKMLRSAYAFIPQSTVGTITNLCFTDTFNYIKTHKLPWTLLNNKHDSLLLQLPDTSEHKEHAKATVKRFMERELKSSRGDCYKMKTGISWGHNWAKYDKDTNPDGMKEEE